MHSTMMSFNEEQAWLGVQWCHKINNLPNRCCQSKHRWECRQLLVSVVVLIGDKVMSTFLINHKTCLIIIKDYNKLIIITRSLTSCWVTFSSVIFLGARLCQKLAFFTGEIGMMLWHHSSMAGSIIILRCWQEWVLQPISVIIIDTT